MKKTNLRITGLLLSAVLTVMMAGCVHKPAAEPGDNLSASKADPSLTADDDFSQVFFPDSSRSQGMSAMLEYVGHTLTEMYQSIDTASVVIGDVIRDDEAVEFDDGPDQAISSIKIRGILKGNLQKGEVIKVVETGERRTDGTDHSIDGVPLMRNGMRVVLFLAAPHSYDGENRYGIRGVYQGKFLFNREGLLYPAASLSQYASHQIKDYQEPITLEEFKALLPLEPTD